MLNEGQKTTEVDCFKVGRVCIKWGGGGGEGRAMGWGWKIVER
jgi:hypothetical protein